MTPQDPTEPLQAGTFVRILNSGYSRAQIAEYRGPLGPKGARIYRVLVQKKPRRDYIEVREDQLKVLNQLASEANSAVMRLEDTNAKGKTMVITLTPDLESTLHDLAQKQGLAPESLVLNVLREHFLPPVLQIDPRDEWERRLLEVATDCGVGLSHEAVSGEGLYE
jgi:hypothetical protein